MDIKNYFKPKDPAEFFKVTKEKEHWKIIAGGTFVSRQKYTKIDTLIDIQNLNFKYTKENNDALNIGSMTTFTDFIETKDSYANGLLAKSFSKCGPITVRNIATIGGNIMGGYYWNDTTPILLYLEAKLLFLKDLDDEIEVKIEDFLNDRAKYKKMLLKEIILSGKYKNEKVFYNRFARTESDIPTSIFLGGKVEGNNKIVIGASTVRPFSMVSKEDISFQHIEEEIKNTHIMDDLRGSSDYKRKIIKAQYNEYKEWKDEN